MNASSESLPNSVLMGISGMSVLGGVARMVFIVSVVWLADQNFKDGCLLDVGMMRSHFAR